MQIAFKFRPAKFRYRTLMIFQGSISTVFMNGICDIVTFCVNNLKACILIIFRLPVFAFHGYPKLPIQGNRIIVKFRDIAIDLSALRNFGSRPLSPAPFHLKNGCGIPAAVFIVM